MESFHTHMSKENIIKVMGCARDEWGEVVRRKFPERARSSALAARIEEVSLTPTESHSIDRARTTR